jgi:5'-nucleotidase
MKILHLDMDDTLCHFKKAQMAAIAKEPHILYPQSQYGFFSNLEPIEGAIEYMHMLTEFYNVHILTRPSVMNPLCYTEKRVWVERYLGFEFCEKLIISPNKALIKGDYLVDDVVWAGFEGKQIVFGSEMFPNWKAVYEHLVLAHHKDKESLIYKSNIY